MLLVDYREGSKALIDPLRTLGLPAEEADLEFGDLAFIGRGEKGRSVNIGVEFKTLRECVGSFRTERLQGHQAPGMRANYDYSWLLIEGELLFNAQGLLVRRVGRKAFTPLPGSMTISEWDKRLLGLHLRGGLNPWHTDTRKQTLRWIEALYRTWTDEDFDAHKSHLGIYHAPTVVPISKQRQALCAWPHVGMRTSKALMQRFGSVRRTAVATVEELAAVTVKDDKGKTRRVGDKAAHDIDVFLSAKG